MSNLMTFHRFLPGCEAGKREAWMAFLSEYSPIAFQLFGLYLPLTAEKQSGFWREALAALGANNFERLRAFEHQAEREFLVDLRGFLLDRALTRLDAAQDSPAPPRPSKESLEALVRGLPLLHQKIVFLTLAGYSQATLEEILQIGPAIADQGLECLKADYALLLNRPEDRCLWPAGWVELTRAARAARQQACAPLRQFVRILDGQASWYDKTPVEEHMSTCLSCLEQWTALREVIFWKRQAKPWPPEKVEPLLACIPLRTMKNPTKSIFARILGK